MNCCWGPWGKRLLWWADASFYMTRGVFYIRARRSPASYKSLGESSSYSASVVGHCGGTNGRWAGEWQNLTEFTRHDRKDRVYSAFSTGLSSCFHRSRRNHSEAQPRPQCLCLYTCHLSCRSSLALSVQIKSWGIQRWSIFLIFCSKANTLYISALELV